MKSLLFCLKELFSRRFFAVLFIELLLFPFLLGIFLSPPIPTNEITFSEEKADLEKALASATDRFLALSPEEDRSMARKEVLFFTAALNFEMNVWQKSFDFEITGTYAELLSQLEILFDHPTEENTALRLLLEEEEKELSLILKEKNVADYLLFFKKRLIRENSLTAEEIDGEIDRLTLRFGAEDSPGMQLLIHHILLLKQSLKEKINYFDPAKKGRPLSEEDKQRLENALLAYQYRYDNRLFDPIPGNTETLNFARDFSSVSLIILLLFAAHLLSRKGKTSKEIGIALLFLAGIGGLLLSLSFSLSVFFSSPGTLLPELIVIEEKILLIPFFLSLILQIFLQILPGLFPLLLWHILFKKFSRPFLAFFISLASILLYMPLSLICRLVGHASLWIYFLPFPYLDLRSIVFDLSPQNLATNSSFLPGLLLLVLIPAFLLIPGNTKAIREWISKQKSNIAKK